MHGPRRGTAILLAVFLGGFGVHRFYIGRVGSGFLFLLFFWTFIPLIISIIDIIRWSKLSSEEFAQRYG